MIYRWDLTSHVENVHHGKKIKCEWCARCFSKRSNLFNHHRRGKGCPQQPGQGAGNQVEVTRWKKNRSKEIKSAEVKNENGLETVESDEEPMETDDRNQSDMNEPNLAEAVSERAAESPVEVRDPPVRRIKPDLEWLKYQRQIGRRSEECNLVMLAETAMRQSSDRESPHYITPQPLNLSTRPEASSQSAEHAQLHQLGAELTSSSSVMVIPTNGDSGHVKQTSGGPRHVSQLPSVVIQLTQRSSVISPPNA